MMSLLDSARRSVLRAFTSAYEEQAIFNRDEQVLAVLDARPLQERETYAGVWNNGEGLSITCYYKLPSIPAILEVLEWLEARFGDCDWTSYDSSEGNRVFNGHVEIFNLHLCLRVTPDIESADATCQRVVVGETVETVRTPTYKIVCN